MRWNEGEDVWGERAEGWGKEGILTGEINIAASMIFASSFFVRWESPLRVRTSSMFGLERL